MIIHTLKQAKRVIIVVFGVTFLLMGGLLFHLLTPDISKAERVLLWVCGPLLLVFGGVFLLAGALGTAQARRYLKIGFGILLLLVGLVMSLPTVPGPGVLTIVGALAILAGEFVWARKLLDRVKQTAGQMKKTVTKNRNQQKDAPAANGEDSRAPKAQ